MSLRWWTDAVLLCTSGIPAATLVMCLIARRPLMLAPLGVFAVVWPPLARITLHRGHWLSLALGASLEVIAWIMLLLLVPAYDPS